MKSKTTKALGIGSAALALSSLFTGELYKYTFCRDIGLFKLLPERKKHDEGYYALRDGTEGTDALGALGAVLLPGFPPSIGDLEPPQLSIFN